jgi:uncharacterized protein (DUF488 family)
MHNTDLLTIGHSNHSAERLVDLLGQHAVEAVVDIRRFPGSRSFPHFNSDELSRTLHENGIDYHWIEALGGRRAKAKGFVSPNMGLRNESFRNYADYMLSDQFRSGIDHLTTIVRAKRTAIMCAESVFWRCHRRLVSDFVAANGGSVQHIFPSGDVRPHTLTPGAHVQEGNVTYPGQMTLFE